MSFGFVFPVMYTANAPAVALRKYDAAIALICFI
jgi:hypothetical protein